MLQQSLCPCAENGFDLGLPPATLAEGFAAVHPMDCRWREGDTSTMYSGGRLVDLVAGADTELSKEKEESIVIFR